MGRCGVIGANPLLLDHFDHPRRVGVFPTDQPGVRRGEAGSPHHGAMVRFELQVGPGRKIVDCRFKAWGCAGTIACASLAAEWLPGRTLDEARAADVRALTGALELPIERAYAPLVVEDAIRAAADEEIE